jgi:hypothetical protein
MTPDEKRRTVLESIDFFTKQRNIALFQVHAAKKEMKMALKNLKESKQKTAFFSNRIIDEVFKNQSVLTEADKKRFIIKREESDNS